MSYERLYIDDMSSCTSMDMTLSRTCAPGLTIENRCFAFQTRLKQHHDLFYFRPIFDDVPNLPCFLLSSPC